MSGFVIKKATKKQSRLRMAIMGPAGGGKTYTSLAVGTRLVPGGKVLLIDAERGSASKYANLFSFDVIELDNFAPEIYVEAIAAGEAAGYDVIIIDSLSHAWNAKGGALEMVDRIAKKSNSGNSFNAWRDVTPQQNKMVDAILRSSAHIVATMRTKTKFVLEEDARGKKVPVKKGMEAIQRDGLEYEFDVVGDMDISHTLSITKTRCPELADGYFEKPGEQLAKVLRGWLTDGVDAPEPMREPVAETEEGPETDVDDEMEKRLADPSIVSLYEKLGYPRAKQIAGLKKFRDNKKLIEVLTKRVEEMSK